MAFYVFDLDGTLADIEHRRPLLPNWDAFFEACDQDLPFEKTIGVMNALRFFSSHRVEIWSARSDLVREKTLAWLDLHADGAGRLLTRMRANGDSTPDEKLKASWLAEERALRSEPDVIFDDRQKVVDMWRSEGVVCFQVNAGDFDRPKAGRPFPLYAEGAIPILTLMVGPSGAGKSTLVRRLFDPQIVVSSDHLRKLLAGDPTCQDHNLRVLSAMHELVATRLRLGLPTVVDATNIVRKDRMALTALLQPGQACAYLVVDRPLDEKIAHGGRRNEVIMGDGTSLVVNHHMRFQSSINHIRKGDGLPHVQVYESPRAYLDMCEAHAAAFKGLAA